MCHTENCISVVRASKAKKDNALSAIKYFSIAIAIEKKYQSKNVVASEEHCTLQNTPESSKHPSTLTMATKKTMHPVTTVDGKILHHLKCIKTI